MKVTVQQVAEAMLHDTTPKTTGTLVRVEDEGGLGIYPRERRYNTEGTVYSCAVGGAALALGVDPDSLANALVGVPRDGVPNYVGDWSLTLYPTIYGWNDGLISMPKAEIGKKILDNADDVTLNTVLNVKKQGRKRLLAFKLDD